MNTEIILNIQTLCKHYEGIVAVDGVNLSIRPGTITGVYGDNGAGKTTLFNLISGFEKPDKGNVQFYGKDITHKSVVARARLGMGRLFQTARVFNDVTVLDNLLAAGNNQQAKYLHNYILKPRTIKQNVLRDTEKAYNILSQFNLKEKASLKAYELSVGERKLLSLGCLLMNDTKLLLLDEPFAGVNEKLIEKIKDVLFLLKSNRLTLLLIEHNKEQLFQISDTVYKMTQGKLDVTKNPINANS